MTRSRRRRRTYLSCYAIAMLLLCFLVPVASFVPPPFRHQSLSRTRASTTTTSIKVAVDPLRDSSSRSRRLSSKKRLKAKPPQLVEQQVMAALESWRAARADQQLSWNVLLFPTIRECNTALATFGDEGDLLRALRLFGKMRKAAALPAEARRL